MKFVRNLLDNYIGPHFEEGGKLNRFYPLYEAADSFLYSDNTVSSGSVHVRDALDLKRTMTMVVIALMPCVFFGMYNTGFQANNELLRMGIADIPGWRGTILTFLGIGSDPHSFVANILHGALYFIPIYLVTNIAGGIFEVLFSIVRKHEVNEGMFVSGFIFPLIVPASIPLWQVALGFIFGIVVAKELFGGTGKNFINPALAGRAFLFFAYPAQISGDAVWVAVDGFSSATALSQAATGGVASLTHGWMESFIGLIPGSFGETSTIACILGAIFLIATGIGSWRIMISVVAGMAFLSLLLMLIGSDSNPMFALGPHWHLALGGFAFGTVFMATDPVTSTRTLLGHYIYGFLIGLMVVLIRVINPAFPEGMMLAIIFGNVFAPLIDFFVVEGNIKKREARYGIK